MVGLLELSWSNGFIWPGRVHHNLAVAGRIDSAGRQQGGICHGVRFARRRDHLESGNVVFRAAGIQFTHSDWLGDRRWHRQSNDVGQEWHFRRRLGTSGQHRQVAAALADRWIRRGRSLVIAGEGAH